MTWITTNKKVGLMNIFAFCLNIQFVYIFVFYVFISFKFRKFINKCLS